MVVIRNNLYLTNTMCLFLLVLSLFLFIRMYALDVDLLIQQPVHMLACWGLIFLSADDQDGDYK